ncbi:ion transporter [Pseudazoarcus pumilus]|uniref:Ion transporter n=1 Tax=Pseudazoarcus pumilus TaxID=2067960 RepID=A0A2I6SAW9_9RHOO|nr:ion transporter [Pseudazoarcus pumilus]AUN96402.1 ion transporter [Pseudazoarcus pumilus]
MSRFHSPEPFNTEGWRHRSFCVVFGHDTFAGRVFDVALIVVILTSVAVALMDTIDALHVRWGQIFFAMEWAFTLLFTAEYVFRMAIVRERMRYARSFYGVIDLLAVLPTYLSLLFPGAQYLAVLRVLRILRIFEVLHLRRYTRESSVLLDSLHNSWRKILVFLLAMLAIITVFGAVIYLVEEPQNGFTSIPQSMYWALVSVTTVGYGDISPATPAGKLVASVLILLGYGIIAVPTGIYTAELATTLRRRLDGRRCAQCERVGHEDDARHCRHCGAELPPRD